MGNEKLYIAQVRAALWGGEVHWPAEQTDSLLRLHAMQGTGALVFPLALQQDDVPAGARVQMKALCMQTMQQQVHLQYTLTQAWTALERAGIRAVLMKGAGLAAFYPEPHLRYWGDIDLYVGAEQYHPACAVMRDTFPDALKFDEELDHYKHYNLIADGVSIEIHRVTVALQHPLDECRYARMEHQGMANSEPLSLNGLEVRIPEPTFNALLIMLHSWEHMITQGAGVRQICDLALLLHHYAGQLDLPRLRRYLKALCLMDVWRLYMCICVQSLGLPADEAPFYNTETGPVQRAERLLNDLLGGRMKDEKGKEAKAAPKNRVLRKIHTMRKRMDNARRMAIYSPAYGRHMRATTWIHGARRFFAKDRHWE